MDERDFYLSFSLISGIGPKTFISLLNYFKSAKNAWEANLIDLKKAGLSDKLIIKLDNFRKSFDLNKYKKELNLKKVTYIALCDKNYPKLLAKIPNPPIVLFVKGNISNVNLDKTIGIVGTRKITNYGRTVTKLFSSDLAFIGLTVVSGLAIGVDAQSAWSAIENKGKTIAVMGNGVDLCFPKENETLYDKILQGNGIIISEFPLGQSPSMGSFPSRNRIIAGLSLGLLVTEGAKDSGSLITADYALKYNRKVFAVPGPITSNLSVAPLKLIEKGAKLVTSAEDIIKDLGIDNNKIHTKCDNIKNLRLSKDELMIIQLVENEGLSFNEIVLRSQLTSSKLGSILSVLEIKGILSNINGHYTVI